MIIPKKSNFNEEIICPYCQHTQGTDTLYNFVSYWGEKGEQECDCESCGETFIIEEKVERTFEIRKKDVENE